MKERLRDHRVIRDSRYSVEWATQEPGLMTSCRVITMFASSSSEQVETPVGTFDTVVVEVTNSFFETRDTYWLISDQPGVYAKWVDHGKVDDEANIVMILQEVIRPGS